MIVCLCVYTCTCVCDSPVSNDYFINLSKEGICLCLCVIVSNVGWYDIPLLLSMLFRYIWSQCHMTTL